MSPDDCVESVNVVLSFHNRQRPFAELLALDHVINEFLEHDARAVQERPDEDVIEEAVPDVDEQERREAGENLVKHRRPSVTHAGVDVLEQELVQPVVEPFPHVWVFVDAADAARRLRHVDPVQLAEGDGHAVVDDVFVVKELSHQVTDAEERQRVQQLQVQVENDAVYVKVVQGELRQEEPEGEADDV